MVQVPHLPICLILIISGSVLAQSPSTAPATATAPAARLPFTISRETTYITGPLDADGAPDYVAALNAEFSKGVTAENNAAIGMLEVIGLNDTFSPVSQEQIRRLLSLSEGADKGMLNLKFDAELSKELETALDGPWEESRLRLLAESLRVNQVALDRFVQACRKSRFWLPSSGPDPKYPWYMSMDSSFFTRNLQVGKMLLARAMLRANEGNVAGSQADWLTVVRLGHLERQSPLLINNLLGIGAIRFAADAAPALLAEWKLSEAQARALLRELDALPAPCPIERVIHGERLFDLDFVTRLPRGDVKSYFEKSPVAQIFPKRIVIRKVGPIDWDEVLRHDNREFDSDLTTLRKNAFAERYGELRDSTEALSEWATSPGERKTITIERLDTKALLDLFERMSLDLNMCVHASMMTELADMRLGILRLAVAVEGYRAAHGTYPPALDAIVPAFVPVVPQDVCSDKPLIYRVEERGFVIYSVGRNMKDDGGIEDPEDALSEIVFCMPPIPRPPPPSPPELPSLPSIDDDGF